MTFRLAWTQVTLASLLMVATLPGRTQGLGLITEPLLTDLGLDRTTYASMNLWATLLGALFCFPTGWAIDRAGLRWVAAFVVLVFGITVWQFSVVAANAALIFALLLGTRALGQSALSVCSIATVAKWFPNRAGFAMGVYSVLLSVFFALAFGGVGYSVRTNGWRLAWMQLAMILVFAIAPLVLVALRAPTGPQHNNDPSPSHSQSGHSLKQALSSSSFWVFAGTAAAFNLVSSGLGLFNEAVLKERGFDQKTFHVFLIATTLMSLVGQFACGWLTRRYRYQTLTFAALLAYSFGLGLIPLVSLHSQLGFVAILIGIAGGMIIVIFFSVWSDLYGQQHVGRIQGAAQMLTVISSGLGPLIFAKCVERTGSYAPLLFALAGISLILGFIAKGIRSPHHQHFEQFAQ